MKKFLPLAIILFQNLTCKAHFIQGFESFYHDTHDNLGIPMTLATANRCFQNLNNLFNHPVNPCFPLPFSTYRWYMSNLFFPPVIGIYWNQTIPGLALGPLTLQQQATLAINRFCIGITNNNPIPAFQDLQGLIDTFSGLPILNAPRALAMQHALTAGGYNTISAQFLHSLFSPGGIPLGIVGPAGFPNQTIALVLKLQHRVSKDIKEIHWASSSFIAINQNLWNNILIALPLPPPPMVPAPAYISIKQRINNPFIFLKIDNPHSATFVLYNETSIN